ncbi:metallophosphoesterase [Bradymonadaceae bacterium TMQ3]|uniref:Metallophosphoesterase n=1 Tax=Lujinxingia sediminis TaxID=2480984 RepID=A0ABY0CWH9_9DELT|nr:metallophosphoesterase family protein [Lujinxingia sediminis]RDV39707.1 metallophosphoesterase [Bradymonadaceae bacterium TMQ3]RVU48248.1 metallophosphoesterase [Lujinxingia sediminis]TXC77548.1 metallophosphoesterase family protein [Bradymonadales bacterium TMQ1]
MPTIAILADVHANLFALDAVIADIARHEIDEVIVAGDMVGRGPQGSAVVARIAELGWRSVKGNHEDYLLSFCRGDIPEPWCTLDEWAGSRWMADELSEEAVAFIDALPFSLHAESDPTLEVFHGSPRSHSEGIGAWTPDDRLRAHFDAIEGSTLICAHTHRPLVHRFDDGLIVNVGSVGLPFNGDWRAQYAILTGSGPSREVTLRQVEYDREGFLRHYQRSGFLTEGNITARLLYREVQAARPFLVPFLKWAELTEREPALDALDDFDAVYEPGISMLDFLKRIDPSERF